MDSKIRDILLVLIAALALIAIAFYAGMQYQDQKIETLPPCDFSVIMNFQGLNHFGYWVEVNKDNNPVCVVRVDNRREEGAAGR